MIIAAAAAREDADLTASLRESGLLPPSVHVLPVNPDGAIGVERGAARVANPRSGE